MEDKTLTPMMRQYHSIKARYREMLLFFRMGDFYEMFEKDAEEASALLNLTLTRRHGIPMCGIPHHAALTYLRRLMTCGKRVAICDQVEDPALAKGIVRREVTRVVTPGTLLDESLLEGHGHNYLAACIPGDEGLALAFCDISTGTLEVIAEQGTAAALAALLEDELVRYAPSELIAPESRRQHALLAGCGREPLPIHDRVLDAPLALKRVAAHFSVSTLDGLGLSVADGSAQAVYAVLCYLDETGQAELPHLRRVQRLYRGDGLLLGATTVRSLELVENLSGGREHTLLALMDRTVTPPGQRLLRSLILKPLLDPARINERLDLVEDCVRDRDFLAALRLELKKIRDLERLASRIQMRRAGPRDLVALRGSLDGLRILKRVLLEKPVFTGFRETLPDFSTLEELLSRALADEPPVAVDDGGVFRQGYDAALDEYRALAQDGEDYLARLQVREREATGIASLKVRYNRVFGYFIEVSKANLALVPEHYQRRQTLTGGERFITPELKEYEEKVLAARERLAALEQRLFDELLDRIAGDCLDLATAARVVAELDLVGSLARIALEGGYIRPKVGDGDAIRIVSGRHPVVERSLEDPFVPNDCLLDLEENRIQIVTGPNMAGKSTYLRQTALLVLMAQLGSFIPAAEAEIGTVDRIFTRIGASDNLARGMSTFLVEMSETAAILNSATKRSLIVLDEIGRGTSTYDGLALAWAIVEYLHAERACGGRTLFATHYHELTVLGEHPGIINLTVAVREWNDEVVFLRKVVPGCAEASYGIHVARLAGLPASLLARAHEMLRELEDRGSEIGSHAAAVAPDGQLSLFRPLEQELLERIRRLDPDRIAPLDALKLLAEFKEMLQTR